MSTALRHLPPVLTADELLDRAFGRATKAAAEVEDPHRMYRAKKQALRMVQSSADSLMHWLNDHVRAWPSLDTLNEFDQAMIDAAVGLDQYRQSLAALQWAGTQVRRIGSHNVSKIQTTGKVEAIHRARREAYGRISSVIERISRDLEFLLDSREVLRALPHVDEYSPCVVVTGAPNVGKSALITALSSGRPEVNHYPFTTRSLHLGHFTARRLPHQLVDTPGLLDRPDAERNAIEAQAVAALRHLGSVVLFLLDERGEAGEPVERQLHLLEEVRELMPDREVLVVRSKGDLYGLPEGTMEAVAAREAALSEDLLDVQAAIEACLYVPADVDGGDAEAGDDALAVATTAGVGVEALRRLIVALVAAKEPDADSDPLALPDGWQREEPQLVVGRRRPRRDDDDEGGADGDGRPRGRGRDGGGRGGGRGRPPHAGRPQQRE